MVAGKDTFDVAEDPSSPRPSSPSLPPAVREKRENSKTPSYCDTASP
jgi:hypothetical protein